MIASTIRTCFPAAAQVVADKADEINKLNVFVTGYDLFTWTSYKGQDPEVSMPSATSLVKDNSTTPVSKRFAIGLNIDF